MIIKLDGLLYVGTWLPIHLYHSVRRRRLGNSLNRIVVLGNLANHFPCWQQKAKGSGEILPSRWAALPYYLSSFSYF